MDYLFQMQAQINVETLKSAGVKKVIASCPHCFNTNGAPMAKGGILAADIGVRKVTSAKAESHK